MGFTYGFLDMGQANFSVGKLECSGQAAVQTGTCNDLKLVQIGIN